MYASICHPLICLTHVPCLLACLLYTEDKGALQPDITELLLQYDDATDIIDALAGAMTHETRTVVEIAVEVIVRVDE